MVSKSNLHRRVVLSGLTFFLAPIIASTIFTACKARQNSSQVKESLTPGLNRCVALRGNGTHMIAHTTSLAKMTQQWGPIDAFAGGSSATMTTFLYESILMNPVVQNAGDANKSRAIALLLKSLVGFAQETFAEPEWKALVSSGSLAKKLADKGTFSLPPSEILKMAADLRLVLGSEDFRALVNPEILQMLEPSAPVSYGDYRTRVLEVRKAAASLVDLDATDADVFFRPGVFNFPYFVSMVGRVADFYAGLGVDQVGMDQFVKSCAMDTSEMLWTDISAKRTEAGTCGEQFARLVRTWKSKNTSQKSSRLLDPPGRAVKSILITSVVNDSNTIRLIKDYEALYQTGQARQLGVSFEHIKFGYWTSIGLPPDLISNWQSSSSNAKARKSMSLGVAKNWRHILEKSPREPSLGKYVEFGADESTPGALSLGGWADLHPVQVLRYAGCEEIIYLTRRTDETVFITKGKPFSGRKPFGLAELLGMGEDDYDQLYNLDSDTSAYSQALKDVDGVWCTDWNKFSAFEQKGIAMDSWNTPLITVKPKLARWSNADVSGAKIRGCN